MGGQLPSYRLSSHFGAVFLTLALSWLRAHVWNFFRPHFGHGMGGKKPCEVLKERSGGLLSSQILMFTVVLSERLLRTVDPKLLTFPFHLKSGTDVLAPYRGTVRHCQHPVLKFSSSW